jgi:hypothetical protein
MDIGKALVKRNLNFENEKDYFNINDRTYD